MRAGISRFTCIALLGLSAVAGCGEQPSAARTGEVAPGDTGVAVAASTPAAVAASAEASARAIACPATIGPAFASPSGGRILGALPAAATPLSYAAVIASAPGDVRDDRVLAEEEPDETATDGTGIHATTATAAEPRSLACGYGMKPGFTEQGTLLIVPLPPGVAHECRVRVGPPGASTARCAPA